MWHRNIGWSRLALSAFSVIAFAIHSTAELSQPPFYKGVTVSCQTWGKEWQTPEMAKTLDELKSSGVNSIAIHPYARIEMTGTCVSDKGAVYLRGRRLAINGRCSKSSKSLARPVARLFRRNGPMPI